MCQSAPWRRKSGVGYRERLTGSAIAVGYRGRSAWRVVRRFACLPSRSTPSRSFVQRSRASGTTTATSASSFGPRSARSHSTSRRATAAKEVIVWRGSLPQRAPTPNLAQRCAWRSPGATCPHTTSRPATSCSTGSPRCSTALARGGDTAPVHFVAGAMRLGESARQATGIASALQTLRTARSDVWTRMPD